MAGMATPYFDYMQLTRGVQRDDRSSGFESISLLPFLVH